MGIGLKDPLLKRKLARFRSLRRGYYSFILLACALVMALFAELWINSRALAVKYNGNYYFPIVSGMIPGTAFDLGYDYETNYRDLRDKIAAKADSTDWVLMPPIPYNEYETDLAERFDGEGNQIFAPFPPSIAARHLLGTDLVGRDVVARLVYGFRICMGFSLILLIVTYTIGILLGCIMGYWGGRFDLIFQRIIEIWSNVPFLYIIIILASIRPMNFLMLTVTTAFFGWMGMTWYMRTGTYREKARDYVLAARTLGASDFRVILHHILPNSIAIIITFVPFGIIGGISSLTSLDYLGFGLQPPTPSWGELLSEGMSHLESPWIVWSVIVCTVTVLAMVTFVGEAVREAFDPKKHTIYE
jgi:microcin C transport system permease protein